MGDVGGARLLDLLRSPHHYSDKEVGFAISSNADQFAEPIIKTMLAKKKTPQTIECPPTKGRYLLLRAKSEHGGREFASCAELGAIGE